jgi:hypothetical protein
LLRKIYLLAAFLFFLALPAHAQFLGYTSPQTVTQGLYSNASCSTNLESPSVTNVGQSVHIVTYTVTGAPSVIVRIMGSANGVNFFAISDDGMGSGSSFTGNLTGYGSFPFVQVWILGCGGGTVTANYVGTSVSTTNPTGTSDESAYQKNLFNGSSLSSNASTIFTPPYGNMGGIIIFNPTSTAPAAGSTLTVEGYGGPGPTIILQLSPVMSNQVFVLPNAPTSQVQVIYTSGGAAAGTFTMTYLFEKPGNLPLTPQCEKTAIINTAAAGPTQIIAIPTGLAPSPGSTVRVCSISVSSATAEAVDFQQGTGTNCGTGNSQLTGLYHVGANAPAGQNFPVGGLLSLPGNAVCIHLSGANQTDGTITYSQY